MTTEANLHPGQIRVRKPNMRFSAQNPVYWFDDNAVATHLWNALFLGFPDGEKLFIKSVKEFEYLVTDTEELKRIEAFVGQEVQHTRMHLRHIETLKEQGFDVAAAMAENDRNSEVFLQIIRKLLGREAGLLFTAGSEHLTAVFAEVFMKFAVEKYISDPEIRNLLIWHAIEEIEHRDIAFDVLKKTGVADSTRAMSIVPIFILTLANVISIAIVQMRQDKHLTPMRFLRDLSRLLRSDGTAIDKFMEYMIEYAKPGFHPNERKLPEEIGGYYEYLKKKSEDAVPA
jgi:uncharacterized protein